MLVRSALAAIDFNCNSNRGVKRTADGRCRFKTRVSENSDTGYFCRIYNNVTMRVQFLKQTN